MPILFYDKDTEDNFLKVAKIVLKFNKHAQGYTPEEIVEKMKIHAQHISDKPSYVAIMGFMITSFHFREDGPEILRLKASVSEILFDV